jgi:hypothetical protein
MAKKKIITPDEDSTIRFMEDIDHWPKWPVLPVKRRTKNDTEIGILWAEKKPIIYLVNMYNIPPDLTKAPQISYESFQALVFDGWVVD